MHTEAGRCVRGVLKETQANWSLSRNSLTLQRSNHSLYIFFTWENTQRPIFEYLNFLLQKESWKLWQYTKLWKIVWKSHYCKLSGCMQPVLLGLYRGLHGERQGSTGGLRPASCASVTPETTVPSQTSSSLDANFWILCSWACPSSRRGFAMESDNSLVETRY